ncbi:MFS transporter [Gulosibacter sp. 10]|uniref:MFS transporter n=1 Tax=Gulosibacter sp. 10 TaxID=1255570 RepID=UPI00097EF7B0|nr:MFS transporter [Gulosibacter sp. 10]SJM63198.1 putative transmembrane efflux protein [Gulosibacter sp. 10]
MTRLDGAAAEDGCRAAEAPGSEGRPPPSGRRRLVLLACLGAGLGTLLDQSTVNFTVAGIRESLGAPNGAVQWYLASYSLTFGLGLVPGGRIGDAWGRRGPFLLGLALFGLGSIVAALLGTIELITICRLMQGFGAGLISAQVLGSIQDEFSGRARIWALTGYSMAGSAAAIFGPLCAGALLDALPPDLGWRAILLLSVPVIALTAVAAGLAIPRGRGGGAPSLDLPGILLLGAFVVLITLPVIDTGAGSRTALVLLLAALAAGGALAAWERRAIRRAGDGPAPLFAPSLLRSRRFVLGNLVAMLWFGATVGHSAVMTLFLLQGFGLSGLAVAVVLLPSAALRLLVSTGVPWAAGRFGDHVLGVALVVQMAAAFLLSGVIAADLSSVLLLLVLIDCVIGIASAFIDPVVRVLTLEGVGSGVRGVAASFLQLTQRLSATFCVAMFTGILFAASGDGGIGRSGAAVALLVNGGIVLAAAIAAFALVGRRGPRETAART